MTAHPAGVKDLAKLLRTDLAAAGLDITHSLALELVAHQHGARDWNTLAARGGAAEGPPGPAREAVVPGGDHGAATARMGPGIPVLRVMSVAPALPFYVDYLGFTVDWEHRFEPGLPLYVQVSRSDVVLHLSEHHGDGSPHGVVWVPVSDVHAFRDELQARPGAGQRPGVDEDSPGGPTLEVIDPYGNVLRFAQPTPG